MTDGARVEARSGQAQPEAPEARRKQEEIEFHDRLRAAQLKQDPAAYARLTSNKKYYAAARESGEYFQDWIRRRSPGRTVLDFGCGDGMYALLAARSGARAYGVDISSVSVENARRHAAAEGLAETATFSVDDCEALAFPDGFFDAIVVAGVLHHMDLPKAYAELARVMKPDGEAICAEALGHNLLFSWYRRVTPHLRTQWEAEHILRRPQIELAERFFNRVDVRFFHLLSLAAVPFRGTRLFGPLLRVFEAADRLVLRLPVVRWQAWQVVFHLSGPLTRPPGS
jgi:2-polyprenyl-3-methyl-5-hydroxy-6-metoxy-1,4-benzoquinol methylase